MFVAGCRVGWPTNIRASDHEGLVASIQNRKDEFLAEMVGSHTTHPLPVHCGGSPHLRALLCRSAIYRTGHCISR
jgi:hypothetical protein